MLSLIFWTIKQMRGKWGKTALILIYKIEDEVSIQTSLTSCVPPIYLYSCPGFALKLDNGELINLHLMKA